jgi:hypothetical protein
MYIMAKSALSLTPVSVQRRSSSAKVGILLDRMENPTARTKCRSIYMRVHLNNGQSSHLNHSCAIRIYGTSKDPKQYMMRPDSRLWMHCHCPYFFWNCEQALTMIKASSFFGLNDDGQRCDPGKRGSGGFLRNPNLTPYPCKHLYAAILTLNRMEAGRSTYKPFTNTKNPYDGDYESKMPASYKY